MENTSRNHQNMASGPLTDLAIYRHIVLIEFPWNFHFYMVVKTIKSFLLLLSQMMTKFRNMLHIVLTTTIPRGYNKVNLHRRQIQHMRVRAYRKTKITPQHLAAILSISIKVPASYISLCKSLLHYQPATPGLQLPHNLLDRKVNYFLSTAEIPKFHKHQSFPIN